MSVSERSSATSVGTLVIPVAHTTARIELRPYSAHTSAREASACSRRFESAVRSVEQMVRPDDRLCPYGLFRVAVEFGPDADAVSPRMLGERLARAVGQGLMHDPRKLGPTTTDPGPNGNRGRSSRGRLDAATVVTVDRLLVNGPPAPTADLGRPLEPERAEPTTVSSVPVPHLRHRTVVGTPPRTQAVSRFRDGNRIPCRDDGPWRGTLLVVDCDPLVADEPGLAAAATGSLAERLGFKTRVTPLFTEDALITDIGAAPIDLVVLLVGAEPTDKPSPWSSSTWCVPAQLAAAYRAAGVDVLAVSAGAGAGALSTCIEKGASVFFGLNELPAELERRSRPAEEGGASSWERVIDGVPPQLDALMSLTSSERRVLFYLTTGTSPRDIASDLVVSLTTVRSHIRSILRKLGVRSQLAAVALANGSGLVHDGADRLTADPPPCPHHEDAIADSA
jgi:DNA-binding NarL/FixJ family response regulator